MRYQLLALLAPLTLYAEYHHTRLYQPPTIKESSSNYDDHLNMFLKPIYFSSGGLQSFFDARFNTPFYTHHFLPSCFIHLIDFIKYGTQTNQPISFFTTTLSLFQQRIKDSSWVNPYALLICIEQLTPLLKKYVRIHDTKSQIHNTLHRALRENFSLLQRDPQTFLATTTNEIHEVIEKEKHVIALQEHIFRFIENATNKIIWNPKENTMTWKSVKSLSIAMEELYVLDLLPDKECFNQLLWGLLYRYGYFIECAGSSLSSECYHALKNDLLEGHTIFTHYEENDTFSLRKRTYLENLIWKGTSKRTAYEAGYISEPL